MRDIIFNLLIENGMTEKSVTEAMKAIQEAAYKEGYEQGLIDGRKSGVAASIRAINGIEKWQH